MYAIVEPWSFQTRSILATCIFEFWRTCEPAVQHRDALPTVGQGHSVQAFVEEHKGNLAEAFTASTDAKQVGQCFAV